MARLIADLPYDLQLEVFKRSNTDDLTQLLIATVKYNQLKIKAASDSKDNEAELSKLRSLIQTCLEKILQSDVPANRTEEERRTYYNKMSSPEGKRKGNQQFITLKIMFQLLELFDTDNSLLTTNQLQALKQSSIFDIFHGFKLQDLFWETLRSAAAGQIKFIRMEINHNSRKSGPEHFVVPTISENDGILKTLKNNDLQVEFAIFGNLCLRYLQENPEFEPKYVNTDGKINEFFSIEDIEILDKYLEFYDRNPNHKTLPGLAVRNIHSGHVLNDHIHSNRFRPEYYWYGIFRQAKTFHEDVCNNVWDNSKLHVTFLTRCVYHRRECVLAALRLE